jgi:cell division protein FtsL
MVDFVYNEDNIFERKKKKIRRIRLIILGCSAVVAITFIASVIYVSMNPKTYKATTQSNFWSKRGF